MKAAKILTRRISGKGYGSFHSVLNGTSRMAECSIIWRVSGIGTFHTFTDLDMELRHNAFRMDCEYKQN